MILDQKTSKKATFLKKNMVANFGFKITFLNSFLCEKIDSFRKFLKNENFGHFPLKNTKNLWKFHKRRVRMHFYSSQYT